MELNRFPSLNRQDYLFSKRMAIIQKSQRPHQLKIQMINNKAVDELIYYLNDDSLELDNLNAPYFKEEVFGADLLKYNLLNTSGQFDRLLKNSLVTEDHIARLEKLNASRSIANKITEAEIERVNQNLKTIEKILNDAKFEIKTYKDIVEKVPRTVSRQDILQRALEDGKNYKGRQYSYKELNQVSKDLENYRDNHSRYEVGKMENNQAQRQGLPSPNSKKVWVWSEMERTRHHRMDGQTVDFYSKFEVVNEKSGDTDWLRFPHDIENEHHNGSNTINCCCSYKII